MIGQKILIKIHLVISRKEVAQMRPSIIWGISCALKYLKAFHAKNKTECRITSPSTNSNSITFTLKPPISKILSTIPKLSSPSTHFKSLRQINAQKLLILMTITKISTLIFILTKNNSTNLISSLPDKNLLQVALPTFYPLSTCTNPHLFRSRPSWKMAKNKLPPSFYFSKIKSTVN